MSKTLCSVLVEPHLEKRSSLKILPKLKRKLPIDMTPTVSRRSSLYSDLHIPGRDEIQKQLDFISSESDKNMYSKSTDNDDDQTYDSYSYASFISYLVETTVMDDEAVESRYIGLMNVPTAILYTASSLREEPSLNLVPSDLGTWPDGEESMTLSREEKENKFSILWNNDSSFDRATVYESSQHPEISDFHSDGFSGTICQRTCIPSQIDIDRDVETMDERICQCGVSSQAPESHSTFSPGLIEERQDSDYVLPISPSCDYSTFSKATEASSSIYSLKEKKRVLEKRFMKKDIRLLPNDRVEVLLQPSCGYIKPFQEPSYPDTNVSRRETSLQKNSRQERFSCIDWCGFFSSE